MPGELYTYAKAAEEQPVLRINGKKVDYIGLEKGFAVIERTWKKGDQVELGSTHVRKGQPMPHKLSKNSTIVSH